MNGRAPDTNPHGGPLGDNTIPMKAVALSFLLASAAFLAAATLRRLNFDEALALRAGFLSLSRIPAEPPFAMPFTVALGALGRTVPDPGVVFSVARLVVALSVLAVLLFSLRRSSGDIATWTLAGTLTLLQATFFVHGLEFRYDAAILLALLLALPLLAHGGSRDLLVLGALAGWLAAHHLKGVVLGLALGVLAVLRIGGRRPAVRNVLIGAAGVLGSWILIAYALGILPDVLNVYTSFAGLAAGAEIRLGPWEALRDAFRRDAAWWLLAFAGVGATLGRFRGKRFSEEAASPDLWALALAAVPIGFLFLHPHPWAYMLALPAPFLAFLMVRRFLEASPSARGAILVFAAGGIICQSLVLRTGPWLVWRSSFEAPRSREVATLRVLRRLARPGEKVIDPSGLAYFLQPCTPEWYVDSLFQPAARQGRWMAGLASVAPGDCPWVVHTYRLDMLPKGARTFLETEFLFVPGGLGLPRGDPRLLDASNWKGLPPERIENFW